MPPLSLAEVVQKTNSCQLCGLHKNGCYPIDLPFHQVEPAPLVVFDYPVYTSTINIRQDPRYRALHRELPFLDVFAATYAVSCRKPAGKPLPIISVQRCQKNRISEIETLQPSFILCVGDTACQSYMQMSVEVFGTIPRYHSSGARVFAIEALKKEAYHLKKQTLETIYQELQSLVVGVEFS